MQNRGYIGSAELTVKLLCADCSQPLQLKDGPAQIGEQRARSEIGPVRSFYIAPCAGCIEKETGPARALKDAIAGLSN